MWKQAQYVEMKENSVLSLQKYPFTRHSDEEKKKDQGAWTRSPVLSVCLRPPKNVLHQPPLVLCYFHYTCCPLEILLENTGLVSIVMLMTLNYISQQDQMTLLNYLSQRSVLKILKIG